MEKMNLVVKQLEEVQNNEVRSLQRAATMEERKNQILAMRAQRNNLYNQKFGVFV